jgi:hypothetical protein
MKLFLAIAAIATTVSFPVWAEQNDNPGYMLNPEVKSDFINDNALTYPMRAHAEARIASRSLAAPRSDTHPGAYDDNTMGGSSDY